MPSANSQTSSLVPQVSWATLIPPEEWRIYDVAVEILRRAGVPFMLGGAFALACYTNRWRNTKDIDFYITPESRDRAIQALTDAEFADYYSDLPYDRRWIYRSIREGCIVDLIWAMANQRAQVEPDWFDYAPTVTVQGEALQCLPAEELLWCKLYIVQRDRCDWPDIVNLLYATGDRLDWDRLLRRVGEDRILLLGMLSLFAWLAPEKAAAFPPKVLDLLPEFDATPREQADAQERRRIILMDSRPWFAAHQPIDQPLTR